MPWHVTTSHPLPSVFILFSLYCQKNMPERRVYSANATASVSRRTRSPWASQHECWGGGTPKGTEPMTLVTEDEYINATASVSRRTRSPWASQHECWGGGTPKGTEPMTLVTEDEYIMQRQVCPEEEHGAHGPPSTNAGAVVPRRVRSPWASL